MNWTNDQQRVIDARGQNILVAAGAGSGKTAVLVERILSLLIDPVHPVDIDRLLVVTFTRAAADEMKTRIRETLEARQDDHPDDVFTSRQLMLLPNARITTIDGFCTQVLRSYGSAIGLEGGFRVADEGEAALLMEDVLKDLFEEEHLKSQPSFTEFMETFAPARNTETPKDLIRKLYTVSASFPDPDAWLDRQLAGLSGFSLDSPDSAPFLSAFYGEIKAVICDCLAAARANLALTLRADGPLVYRPTAESEAALFENLNNAFPDYDAMRQFLTGYKAAALSRAKAKPGEDPALRDIFKNRRNTVKDGLKLLRENYLRYKAADIEEAENASHAPLRELIRLTKRFREMFDSKKRAVNMLDFNDLEQLTLRVLRDGSGNPTAEADEIAGRFEYVMIDEYQDSSFLQEEILRHVSGLRRGKDNYFMVGDVKQSIYSFRQARPELFTQKYDLYRRSDGGRLIDLHANFRSRREVLASVNSIFSRIMRREVGEIDYDEAAALVYGAESLYPPLPDGTHADYMTKFMITYAPENENGKTANLRITRKAEAEAIAAKIGKILKTEQIYDKKEKTYRRVRFRDIVILLRSLDLFAETLQDTLREHGIPVYTTQKQGYFKAPEVLAVLSYLTILDNPRPDIPLAAVLRSAFFRFHSRELAALRAFSDAHGESPQALLWDCVRLYAAEGDNLPLREKMQDFLRQFGEYRDEARRIPIHELIFRMLSETGFSDYVSALPGGRVRAGNLSMLISIAQTYETTSYTGLYHFVRYVNQLREYKIDTGEASAQGEGENAVRIMTIHSSKGLEFPIVFCANLSKKFNRRDLNAQVLIHPRLGIASDSIRLADRVKIRTISKATLARDLKNEANGEELRVLYVAMTRAEQKLILSTVIKDRETLEKNNPLSSDGTALSPSELAGASSFCDFLLPAALRCAKLPESGAAPQPDSAPLQESATQPGSTPLQESAPQAGSAPLRFVEITDAAAERVREEQKEEDRRLFEALRDIDLSVSYDPALHDLLADKFMFHYPHEGLDRMPAKISVSDLKTARYYDEDAFQFYEAPPVIPLIPSFMREEPEEITGAGRGTVYHRFLELYDYSALTPETGAGEMPESALEENIELQLQSLTDSGRFTPEDAAVLRPSDIAVFLRSRIGRRMARAARENRLFREAPFTFAVPADTIDPSFPSTEQILVQGVVDAYFIENGSIILVDYKTDRVSSGNEEELVRKYRTQLLTYADALQRLTGLAVTEQYIYSFSLRREIPVR